MNIRNIIMLSYSSWVTQVEVAAAASLFNIPVYYCVEKNNIYKWNVIKPLTNKEQRPIVKCLDLDGVLDDEFRSTYSKPTHFELLYFKNTHAIVSATTEKVCTTPPPLSTCTNEDTITIV